MLYLVAHTAWVPFSKAPMATGVASMQGWHKGSWDLRMLEPSCGRTNTKYLLSRCSELNFVGPSDRQCVTPTDQSMSSGCNQILQYLHVSLRFSHVFHWVFLRSMRCSIGMASLAPPRSPSWRRRCWKGKQVLSPDEKSGWCHLSVMIGINPT